MHLLAEKPREIQDLVFQRLFEVCEIGKFPEAERVRYMENLSATERMEEALKYAKQFAAEQGRTEGLAQGRAEGRAEGHLEGHAEGLAEGHAEGTLKERLEIVNRMLQEGCSWSLIQKVTGVSEMDWKATLHRSLHG